MPKIVLVFGVHSNENEVTEFVAEKLKLLLQKRGHETELLQVPTELSFQATVKKAFRAGKTINPYTAEAVPLRFIAEQSLKQKNAFFLDIHCGETVFSKGKRMLIRPAKHAFYGKKPLVWMNNFSGLSNATGKTFVLELPAVYVEEPQRTRDIAGAIQPILLKRDTYFFGRADLAKTIASGFLSEKVLQRLGHLVNSQVMTHAGHFRIPKRLPFARKPKTTSASKTRRTPRINPK